VPDGVHVPLLASAPADLNLTAVPAVGRDVAPVVLVLPGGGYRFHADHEAEPVARWLSGLGLHAVVLRYGVEADPLASAERDARAALAWLRSDGVAGWADRRVGVLGFSAGGHLAGLLATGDEPPDLAVLCYPLTSFVDEPERLEEMLGMPIPADRRSGLTLALRARAGASPTFLWHAADDPVVPAVQSLTFAQALAAAGVPVELHLLERGGHGAGLAADRPAGVWTRLCRAWFAGHGWLAAEGAPA
jgi:acetyl esterase/lipase